MSRTYKIANLAFGKSSTDCAYRYSYGGQDFEVQRFGANFSVAYMRDLMVSLRNSVDAFAISDLPPIIRVGGKSYVHRQSLEVMSTPSSLPLCDGGRLRELSVIQSLSTMIAKGQLDPRAGIFFPTALLDLDALYMLVREFREYIRCGDLFSLFSLPMVTEPNPAVEKIAQMVLNFANFRDIADQTPMAQGEFKRLMRGMVGPQIEQCQHVFADPGILLLFGEQANFIRGKDLILTAKHPWLIQQLEKFQPRSIHFAIPQKFDIGPYVNFPVLDATLRIVRKQDAPLSLEEWEKLLETEVDLTFEARRFVRGSRPSPQAKVASLALAAKRRLSGRPKPDFAFVVHALSQRDLFRVPGVNLLKGLPKDWRKGVERLASHAPGIVYGHVDHVVSQKNGREVNGLIYALLSTPAMLKHEPPEVTYQKIESLCHHAADAGAKIIGLGAYTKVVGDAGATINRLSPIPVTTGNSLSASSTLWAVHEVARKIGLEDRPKIDGLLDGTALVIGATGSIGKVSAKLLALAAKRLILVAPRMDKLLELKMEIGQMSANCEIFVSTDANTVAPEADILVTATSAFDQRIVNVDVLKPGAIVCDCSRPLDFTKEDALKRPDVLIIESGEVILPGPVDITCDLGLPDDSVYACLGETAVLAMEGLYEPFTLGREIDYTKVKRIYKMAREHGVKLAAIRGHLGIITDREIEITKDLARKRLKREI